MKKIDNWQDVQEGSLQLTAGIYMAKIVQVEDITEKTYLRVSFDITEGPFKGYFGNQKAERWPYLGTFIRSYKESALTWFKAFITAIEKSNDNFSWKWNEQDLVGKSFVVVFGEEEYLDEETNEIKVGLKPVDIRSIKALQEGKVTVPQIKKLKNSEMTGDKPVATTSKQKVEVIKDEDLPF
jgi:hypothetical protein